LRKTDKVSEAIILIIMHHFFDYAILEEGYICLEASDRSSFLQLILVDSFPNAVISGVMIADPAAFNFSSLHLSTLARPWRHDFEDSFRLWGCALS
jgi:hypothetical protein